MEVLGYYTERGDGIKNEDVVGFQGDYFWIIDGATDLFHLNLFESEDDVALYVESLSISISEIIEKDLEKDLAVIIKNAINLTNMKLGLDIDSYEIYKMPSFAILLAEHQEFVCRYLVLGDCFMQVKIADEIVEITDRRISQFSQRNKEGLQRLIKDEMFSDKNEKELYRKTRMCMNKQDGYWIGSVDGVGIEHAIQGQVEIDKDSICLAYTDGLMETFDLFKLSEIDMSIFNNDNLLEIVRKLRVYQSEDSEREVTRVRKRDDLSYLLVR